jgi:mercuric ion transport protein
VEEPKEAFMDRRILAAGPMVESKGPKPANAREAVAAYLTLFTSLATLFCCALPALLVLVGFSLTSVLTFFTSVPGWQSFGQYDIWLFPLSGLLLAVGFYFAYFRQNGLQEEACEIPAGGRESACSTATRWNRRILWLSLSLYGLALIMNFWGVGWMKGHSYFNR